MLVVVVAEKEIDVFEDRQGLGFITSRLALSHPRIEHAVASEGDPEEHALAVIVSELFPECIDDVIDLNSYGT
ncbi:hypothetical protein HMPREF3151_03515 [Corynebacterium sp. HMSC05H05]|nr:hypothetical protein HMPREF3151_03515 [Corynebacterium sp. HMSC05H05]